MKRSPSALAILAGLAMTTGFAWGADSANNPPLQGITVRHYTLPNATADRPLGDCTPPADLAVCAPLHRELRARFNDAQIGMLFGAASSHMQYFTTYDFVRADYQRFLDDYVMVVDANDANRAPAVALVIQ